MSWVTSTRVFVDGQCVPKAVCVASGKIAAIVDRPADLSALSADRETIFDAGDALITPGMVDSHVHINEPGRTEWEGFETATQAAAAGGITTVVDMPLNCIPATTTLAAAEKKRESLQSQLSVNVVFWGGVVPGNVGELAALARFGVPGAKCFLVPSGVDEFPCVTREHLELALPVLRDLGLVLLVHAELPGPIEAAEASLVLENADPRAYATYLASRPNAAEDQAIALVIELAEKHRAPVHIVHLSSASALPMIRAAQERGVAITVETCLHYLAFAAEEIPDGATHFKCAPPIRGRANREALWGGLLDGTISMVVSDHSPCTPALKKPETGDFLSAWGGISGLQFGLPVLHTLASRRQVSLAQMIEWNVTAPARLAGLQSKKGKIAVGYDADLVVWSDSEKVDIQERNILHKHKVTPYAGQDWSGVVERTMVGGEVAYDRRTGLGKRAGRFEVGKRG